MADAQARCAGATGAPERRTLGGAPVPRAVAEQDGVEILIRGLVHQIREHDHSVAARPAADGRIDDRLGLVGDGGGHERPVGAAGVRDRQMRQQADAELQDARGVEGAQLSVAGRVAGEQLHAVHAAQSGDRLQHEGGVER